MLTVQTLKDKVFQKTSRGFTLIELMIVISIIAILATIALAGLAGAQKGARDTQRQQMANAIRAALERYYADNGSYPAGPWYSAAATTTLFNAVAVPTGALDSYMASGALTDPGCGTAATRLDVKVNPYPCNTGAGGTTTGPAQASKPGYEYASVGTASPGCGLTALYELKLTKESGGVSYFCPPK